MDRFPLRLSAFLIACAAFLGAAKTPEEFLEPSPKPAVSPRAQAAKAPAETVSALDTARIHATYLDGDFDKSIRILEGALKGGGKGLNHADSVFIFKHLGVMYAASPDTREKGRFYMLQLISIEPTAKILDMYASDMIYLIFHNVQEEYEKKHGGAVSKTDSAAAPPPAAGLAASPRDSVRAPAAAQPARNRRGALYWAVGGAAVAAGTAGLLFILLDHPEPKKRAIVLDE